MRAWKPEFNMSDSDDEEMGDGRCCIWPHYSSSDPDPDGVDYHLINVKSPDSFPLRNNDIRELSVISSGRLLALPDDLSRYTNLRRLEINQTSVRQLPDSLGHIDSLVELKVMLCGRLTSLPESIGGLRQLMDLEVVSNNHITALPESIGLIPTLTHLRIEEDSLTQLPATLRNLQSLTYLDIISNDDGVFQTLPSNLGHMPNLSSLCLMGRWSRWKRSSNWVLPSGPYRSLRDLTLSDDILPIAGNPPLRCLGSGRGPSWLQSLSRGNAAARKYYRVLLLLFLWSARFLHSTQRIPREVWLLVVDDHLRLLHR